MMYIEGQAKHHFDKNKEQSTSEVSASNNIVDIILES